MIQVIETLLLARSRVSSQHTNSGSAKKLKQIKRSVSSRLIVTSGTASSSQNACRPDESTTLNTLGPVLGSQSLLRRSSSLPNLRNAKISPLDVFSGRQSVQTDKPLVSAAVPLQPLKNSAAAALLYDVKSKSSKSRWSAVLRRNPSLALEQSTISIRDYPLPGRTRDHAVELSEDEYANSNSSLESTFNPPAHFFIDLPAQVMPVKSKFVRLFLLTRTLS